ncbi:mechanosensitive ion channel family protein [Candidatus Saccharibacteria bacterium]|nr:mechanosensitive ion channel family protein [Candidatus Saccharibacteria bacterium]
MGIKTNQSSTASVPNKKRSVKVISDKRRKTYLRMLRSIVIAAAIIIVVLIILQLFGINVSSMLAGVGIASIVIGFALQDAMKDIFRGLEIVSDNYYDIGDIIKFGDNVGEVLSINLRTTRIQDINSMNIVSIANRNIDKVEIVSEYIYLQVPLPYEIKPAAADLLMHEIVKDILKVGNVVTAEFQGLTAITDSTLQYQIAITCDPKNKLQVRRDSLGVVTEVLAAHKLRLPYRHVIINDRK